MFTRNRFFGVQRVGLVAMVTACTIVPAVSQSRAASAMSSNVTTHAVYLPSISHSFPSCDDIEDNDIPAQAQPLTSVGQTCTGSFEDDPAGEDDYYLVTLDEGQRFTLELTGIPEGADYDLIVYRQGADVPVATSNELDQADERISYTVAANGAGVYLVRLNMYVKSATMLNTYVFRAAIE